MVISENCSIVLVSVASSFFSLSTGISLSVSRYLWCVCNHRRYIVFVIQYSSCWRGKQTNINHSGWPTIGGLSATKWRRAHRTNRQWQPNGHCKKTTMINRECGGNESQWAKWKLKFHMKSALNWTEKIVCSFFGVFFCFVIVAVVFPHRFVCGIFPIKMLK